MPLNSAGQNAFPDLAGLGFGMTDGKKIVVVHVSHEALDDIEPTTTRGRDYLGIFDRNRAKIESIASRKYDAGHLESDGTIHVRTNDLNR
jgi:hypothetical protein